MDAGLALPVLLDCCVYSAPKSKIGGCLDSVLFNAVRHHGDPASAGVAPQMKYAIAGLATFVAMPLLIILGVHVTVSYLGPVFFFCWAVPVSYCLFRSF